MLYNDIFWVAHSLPVMFLSNYRSTQNSGSQVCEIISLAMLALQFHSSLGDTYD